MKTIGRSPLLIAAYALVAGLFFVACGGDDEGSGPSSDPNQHQCTDQCAVDDTRCSDGGLQICESAGACASWSDAGSCPDDQVCSGGACVDQCQDACLDGERECDGASGYRICEEQSSGCLDWSSERSCDADLSCQDGLCIGDCDPGQQRCNGDDVEVCNDDGTGWDVEQSCSATRCEPIIAACAEPELDITSDTDLDGQIFVDGSVIVRTDAHLHSPTGELYLHATSITVESGASITVAATGEHPDGQGADDLFFGASGGGHGESGQPVPNSSSVGSAFARGDEVNVTAGSRGGTQNLGDSPGMGGGVLHLVADSIDISGSLIADGADGIAGSESGTCTNRGHSGGGSGGGILLAADDVHLSGSISVQPGIGVDTGCTSYFGGDGGLGVVKLLYGGGGLQNNGTIDGVVYEGMKAPMPILSSTHPDPSMMYNDDFDDIVFGWPRPFPTLQGYYRAFNTSQHFLPAPDNASFLADETVSYSREDAADGANYFHITPVDSQSVVGQMASRLLVQVNTLPPLPDSSSHPAPEEWSPNRDVFMSWSDPRGDDFLTGYHYRVDQWGDSVPDDGDAFVPSSQQQQILADQDDGIWAFHIASVDTMGYLTRQSGTHVFRIGDDPGQGQILGTVIDQDGDPIEGAHLSLNRGLLRDAIDDATTTSSGAYNYGPVPAGEWSLQISAEGFQTKELSVTLGADEDHTVDIILDSI